ncbi:MAG: PIG-L deacetylase family protein [Owenweeksia sp.]
MHFKSICCTLFAVLTGFSAQSQSAKGSSEILHDLEKLKNSTTVLYLAAHPDDENTRMISWLVNGYGARTAYLSLTRGDGGQNLIGKELGSALGVLRTQELLHARRIDGGEQFFSRAVDFGYSKTADETLEKWDRQAVLSDVVFVIRKFRPDVIITRFPPDSRGGHGHHTASAMLGIEAFNMAADENAFPQQLRYVETWQPKRIYWNASSWWNPKLDSIARVDDKYVVVEVGGYNALQGTSYNELASMSRTQHKSQGFGVSVDRGSQKEYLMYLDGEQAQGDIFQGISGKWERFGFKEGDKQLQKIINQFDPLKPQRSLPALLELREKSAAINDEAKGNYFRKQLDGILRSILGLHLEALSTNEYISPGEPLELEVQVLSRVALETPVTLERVEWKAVKQEVNETLKINEIHTTKISSSVSASISQPYWLLNDFENLYQVNDLKLIGKPENDPSISIKVVLSVNNTSLDFMVPVRYKFSNRVEGEIVRPAVVVPKMVASIAEDNLLFFKDKPQTIKLQVRHFTKEGGTINLSANGWNVYPSSIELPPNQEVGVYPIEISPGENAQTTTLKLKLDGTDKVFSMAELDYSHIEKQVVFTELKLDLIRISLRKKGTLVGYIPGAGDNVAEAIARMGYEVDILDRELITTRDLSNYKAIVSGIRAYNTEEWLPGVKPILMEYVKNGGNYIVQYNTRSRDLLTQDIGPYPFELSRERVTEEDAEAIFNDPQHPVFNKPNVLSATDFEGWVQERGLYFAGEWDEAYVTPLGWHDKGETTQNGGLLIGNYGKGAFIYTGISFFRELPAGVAGAYRLMANILSYTNPSRDEQP